MRTLSMDLSRAYLIKIGQAYLLQSDFLAHELSQLDKKIVIITDSNLVNGLGKKLQQYLQEQGLCAELLAFKAGEINKTRATKEKLEDILLAKKYGRDTCFIALGGGVVTDLVGFLAATFCRGVPVIYIPTTLLAMVDASIGGKTGVNTLYGKNLIGAFSQPQAVFIDTETLTSLSPHEFSNGMVELIKHAVIADQDLFNQLTSAKKIEQSDPLLIDIIYRSCLVKKSFVEQDEHELNKRQLLNFGHTIGHAIETIENYKISHGEAVAIGMLVEAYLSVKCGYLDESELIRLHQLLQTYQLPLVTQAFKDKKRFYHQLMSDKKNINRLPRFVLLKKNGETYHEGNTYSHIVNPLLLEKTINWAGERFIVSQKIILEKYCSSPQH